MGSTRSFTGTFSSDSGPAHIREVVDNSLRNLAIDSIDLLYRHTPDPNVPIEDVVGVMKEFVDAGEVKYLGLSDADEDTLRRAHAVHPISALQNESSVFAPHDAEPLFPVLEELGIGFVACSPLARGFLSGAVKPRDHSPAGDFRQQLAWWKPENFDANLAIGGELTKFAEKKDATLARLALAWLLAKKDYVVPIPGPFPLPPKRPGPRRTRRPPAPDHLRRRPGCAAHPTVRLAPQPLKTLLPGHSPVRAAGTGRAGSRRGSAVGAGAPGDVLVQRRATPVSVGRSAS